MTILRNYLLLAFITFLVVWLAGAYFIKRENDRRSVQEWHILDRP